MSNSGVLDTQFRSALERMAVQGRLNAYTAPIDPHLEVAAVMKKLDGGPALLFSAVDGYDMPVVGNLMSCQANCEAAFGIDFNGIREFVGRALGSPQPPVLVEKAPAQEHIHTDDIDLVRMLPALHHTAADAGRYVTAEIVIVRIPTPAPTTLLIIASRSSAATAPPSSSTSAVICAWLSSAPSATAKRCRSQCASAPTWRCTTPQRPWDRRCRNMPTRSPSPADCAGGRSRS